MDAAISMRPLSPRPAGMMAAARLGLVVAAHGAVLLALPEFERPPRRPPDPVVVTLLTAPKPLPESPPPIAQPLLQPKRPPAPPKPAVKTPSKPPPRLAAPVPVAPAPAAIEVPSPAAPAPVVTSDARTVEPPAPVASAPAATVKAPVVAPRFDAAYLNNPRPEYPRMARRLGEQGKVLLNVYVGTSGSAEKVEIRTSSGSPRLDQAAREAVTRWKFIPARRGDEPVAAWVLVPITFVLEG